MRSSRSDPCCPHLFNRNLDCEDLDAIGVADSAHRDVLLGRTAPLVAANPPRTSAAARSSGPETFEKKKQSFTMEADPFDQFEAIFQDIDDMIVGMTSLQTTEVRETGVSVTSL